MGNSVQTEPVIRFQDFQVNLDTGELWKAGVRLKLQDQPFKVLATLLQRPGQVVPREELQQLIWPQESFGDFDHAINLAIAKLRATLGDSADVPHLIETLPRRGYRFIAPVETVSAPKRFVTPAVDRLLPHWLVRSFEAIRKHPWPAFGMAAMLVLGILLGQAARHSSLPSSSKPVTRAVIKLEPGLILEGFRLSPPFGLGQPTQTAMAISSDGHFIVYSAIRENSGPEDKPQLYLRRIGELEAKAIPGTEGGVSPFLSPDDRWVGFWADGKLMKVSIDGGVPVFLSNSTGQPWPARPTTENTAKASWGPGNRVVFASDIYARLFLVSADGGTPEVLTTPDRKKGEFSHCLPHWLPDGKGVLFTILREWFEEHPLVAILDLKTRKWRVLLEDAADASYVPTGHLVFLREGTLMVVPFDLERREVSGRPVPAIANVIQALNVGFQNNTAAGQFSISGSGSLVYAAGGINPERQDSLVWVDMKGNATPITSFKAPFWAPRLSPDGRRISYITVGRECHAWIYDLQRDTATQLTGEEKMDFAQWTPDGKGLVFKGWRAGEEANLYWQPVDGSSAVERLTTSDNHQVPGSFTPDGTTLAFVERNLETKWGIQLLDMKRRRVTPFQDSKADELFPDFSPDGHWMAYTSYESGRNEVYVRPFPGPGGQFQVSSEEGYSPVWSRNGKQLFYGGPNGEYFVVDVRTDGSFSASKPRLLFKSSSFSNGGPCRGWDITPDGQHLLMVKYSDRKPQPVTELVLVQNWFEELQRLAPSSKK